MAHLHHDHDGGHPHRHERLVRRAFVLIAGFMLVEVAGGLFANSLTLLADAAHMFLDASALGFSWYALHLSKRGHDHNLSYGYHRYQVLATFLNGLMLWGLIAWILLEAWQRLQAPEGMFPVPALAVALVGLLVNVVAFRWLHHGHDNATVRSAALHVLGDMLGSAAAVLSALIVWLTGWLYADPLLAVVIALILARGAWRLVRDSTHILLEGVPEDVNLTEIRDALASQVPGVLEVHHLHAWALTAERPLLTLHARVEEGVDLGGVMAQIKVVLNRDFGIDHSTIQVEHGPCPDD